MFLIVNLLFLGGFKKKLIVEGAKKNFVGNPNFFLVGP